MPRCDLVWDNAQTFGNHSAKGGGREETIFGTYDEPRGHLWPRLEWPRSVSGCGGLWSFVPPGLFRKLPRHVMIEKHVLICVTGNAVASGLLPYRRMVPGVLQVVFCSFTGRRNHPCHKDQ